MHHRTLTEATIRIRDRKRSRRLGFLFAVFVLVNLGGCARSTAARTPSVFPSPTSSVENLADAPTWVTRGCRSHWFSAQDRKHVVCGVGSAVSNRNRIAARDTAVARARSAIARSVTVMIESLVRVEDLGTGDGDLRTIAHQLTSASLPSCQLESVWQSNSGEVHALVSLDVEKVQQSVRSTSSIPPAAREDLARRALDAFEKMNATLDAEHDESRESDPSWQSAAESE